MSGAGKAKGRAARARGRAAAGLAALLVAGCAEKITTVDPTFTAPEGVASTQTGLVVWRELPNMLHIYERGNDQVKPPIPDVLVDSVAVASPLPGQIHGLIRDSTLANAYQIYRREPNGGYLELFDFTAVPARRWFDRGWEIYHFTDAQTAVPTHTYLCRGVVGGAATLLSPLTNEAADTVSAVLNIHYTGPTGINPVGEPVPLDSLFLMSWDAVPNAVAYFIHVYQWSFNLISIEEQIASGNPAPLFIGKSRDVLVAYLPDASPPGSTVSFTMPPYNARPPNARVLTVRETGYGEEYLVRVAAIDRLGQLIAYTYGHTSVRLVGEIPGGITLPSSQFAQYFLGAVRVITSR